MINNLKSVKKNLVLNSLIKDLNEKRCNYNIKHIFSLIIKNVYLNIYMSKINNNGKKEENANKFYEMINKNDLSFDELFSKFINDDNFSTYLIGKFYFDNLDKNMIDFEEDELCYQKYHLEEKIKKYYI